MARPLVIDLFCGLGGWSKGFLAEGWDAVGFDIERHRYPLPAWQREFGLPGETDPKLRGFLSHKQYPAQLVLQDVLTLDGWQFRGHADMIVATPPCQRYSYMAMPWKRAKAQAAEIRADQTGAMLADLNALFNACFRIAAEAELPLVVENVKGAQPWVGRAHANFGSYYLWGDIANVGGRIVRPDELRFGALSVKAAGRGAKNDGGSWFNVAHNTESGCGNNPDGRKVAGFRFDGNGGSSQSASVKVATVGEGWRTDPGKGARFTSRDCGLESEGVKQRGSGREWFAGEGTIGRTTTSNSPARKAASAQIAEIPLDLASWVARCFKP